MIIKFNPLYAHEHKRIDELLGSIDNELKQINGVREQKAKRIELLSSLCEKVVSIKTLDELKTILPLDLHSELKQVLYPTYYPVIEKFDHLDLFNNRFTVEQITDALKALLKKETTVEEPPVTGKELVQDGLTNKYPIEVHDPNSLLILPTEVLFKIFQFINNRRDYRCLSLACRSLREISNMKGARDHVLANPSIPDFLQCEVSSTTSMTREAVLLQAKEIENNLKSNNNFNNVAWYNIPKYKDNLVRTVIDDHLVVKCYGNSLESKIVLRDLQKEFTKEIQGLNCNPTTMAPVHGAVTPLLVTAFQGGFKIWDFESLKTAVNSDSALLLEVETGKHQSSSIYAPSYKELKIHSFNNVLIVGDSNPGGALYFIDCSQGFKKENVLKVHSKEFTQIIMNEEQAFVVHSKEITVWNIAKVKECIADKQTVDPKNAAQTWKFDENIGHIKVLENEVVVAYNQSKLDVSKKKVTLGELLKRADGTLVRKLSYNATSKDSRETPMPFIDASDHMLISSNYNQILFWDMDTNQDVVLKSAEFEHDLAVRKITVIGRHILCTLPGVMLLLNQDDLSKIITSRNSKMKVESDSLDIIESCDLFGKYLITVNSTGNTRNFYVYNLLDCSKK